MRDTMRKARRNTHKPTHSTRRPDPAVQSRQQPQATGTGSPCREEGADTQGSSLTILRKPHTHFPFNWPSPSFYGMKHPCEIKTHFHMRACMWGLQQLYSRQPEAGNSSHVLQQNWRRCECIHTTEHYSAISFKGTVVHTAAWVNLRGLLRSESSQDQNEPHYVCSLLEKANTQDGKETGRWVTREGKTLRTEECWNTTKITF